MRSWAIGSTQRLLGFNRDANSAALPVYEAGVIFSKRPFSG